ncbi:hypothetical protein [Chondromyces apiculatus]|uniref:STAS domain-containing protein n=1 Tax=Chondromyces apiculatus DSM 436 TaxID=1192034 RepID=A0A017SX69_9BACT|nr:hypothetical protein [Chondromyces apiculatus]EYF01544.1 Hypothetical protein CAP_7984 [Chondromyces apiculatus DSM 436]
MKTLSYGEITDGGLSVFQSVARLEDDGRLVLTFEGAIRIDNPYRYLSGYLDELARVLPQYPINATTMDFVKMRFCNSNGFYVIMDIVDAVYNLVPGPVVVRRISDDDWQHETLPILLNLSEEHIAARTTFDDVREP